MGHKKSVLGTYLLIAFITFTTLGSALLNGVVFYNDDDRIVGVEDTYKCSCRLPTNSEILLNEPIAHSILEKRGEC